MLSAWLARALDFSGVTALRELGLDGPGVAGEMVEQGLQELFERGWLTADEPLRATDAGREHLRRLRKGMRRQRERHRLSKIGQ
jgi:hypothetical protein